jgi:hypothetical protein
MRGKRRYSYAHVFGTAEPQILTYGSVHSDEIKWQFSHEA